MDRPRVRIYTDYKSPYAFVANKRLFELEHVHGVELEWLPYTLRIPEFMGTVEERTPHFWRKVRYSYMDARRHANAQGLTMKGPRRIYDAFYSSAGMLFAQRHGLFRPYLGVFGVPTMVFNGELFWGGDRIDMLIERIRNPESIAMALGSRRRT